MYRTSAGVLLPTSIIGSLPRPAWHTVQLGSRSFLEAMVNARWREQYEDAVSTHLPRRYRTSSALSAGLAVPLLSR